MALRMMHLLVIRWPDGEAEVLAFDLHNERDDLMGRLADTWKADGMEVTSGPLAQVAHDVFVPVDASEATVRVIMSRIVKRLSMRRMLEDMLSDAMNFLVGDHGIEVSVTELKPAEFMAMMMAKRAKPDDPDSTVH